MINPRLDASMEASGLPGCVDLLNDFALSGGKQLRPTLVLTISGALGVSHDEALPYAIAAERVHGASLLHDDVIDESTVRRGRSTFNASGKNRQAVLAGDLLLAEALRGLSKTRNYLALENLIDVLATLSEGELLQNEARNQIEVSERHLFEVATKKTGSLIAWCCATPLLIKELPAMDSIKYTALKRLGLHVGTAFQLIDDCIDFDSSSGKPFAQDLREGLINFVTCYLLEQTPQLKQTLFSEEAVSHIQKSLAPALNISIKRTLDKAKIEVSSASAYLERAGFDSIFNKTIHDKVLQPFYDRIDLLEKNL